jgi:8-oxo-dGTP pyrophosphatase MutT (NUDIX family)
MVNVGGMSKLIHAAGGVLWRPGSQTGTIDIAIVHRPCYDDWTLPKGKRNDGEADLDAAVREVREETGYHVEVGPELGETRYDHRGRDKRVRYWSMRAVEGRFVPTKEVDRLEWVSLDEVTQRLTYERDREIVRLFMKSITSD